VTRCWFPLPHTPATWPPARSRFPPNLHPLQKRAPILPENNGGRDSRLRASLPLVREANGRAHRRPHGNEPCRTYGRRKRNTAVSDAPAFSNLCRIHATRTDSECSSLGLLFPGALGTPLCAKSWSSLSYRGETEPIGKCLVRDENKFARTRARPGQGSTGRKWEQPEDVAAFRSKTVCVGLCLQPFAPQRIQCNRWCGCTIDAISASNILPIDSRAYGRRCAFQHYLLCRDFQ